MAASVEWRRECIARFASVGMVDEVGMIGVVAVPDAAILITQQVEVAQQPRSEEI